MIYRLIRRAVSETGPNMHPGWLVGIQGKPLIKARVMTMNRHNYMDDRDGFEHSTGVVDVVDLVELTAKTHDDWLAFAVAESEDNRRVVEEALRMRALRYEEFIQWDLATRVNYLVGHPR